MGRVLKVVRSDELQWIELDVGDSIGALWSVTGSKLPMVNQAPCQL